MQSHRLHQAEQLNFSGFAITDQLAKLHPLKQVEKCGIAGSLGQLQVQRTAACLVTTLGKLFQIPVATAPT